MDDVVPDQLEASAVQQVDNIISRASEEVVEADDFVAGVDQPLAEMGPHKPGAPGNQYPHGC
jgi:hypothetical protein